MRSRSTSFRVITVLLAFGSICRKTAGQVINVGGCPIIQGMSPFNISAFSGKWYEVASLRNSSLPVDVRCTTATYQYRDGYIDMEIHRTVSAIVPIPVTSSVLVVMTKPNVGGFVFTYDNLPFPVYTKVVDTDYSGYAIVFQCLDFVSIFHFEFVQIWSRFQPAKYPPNFDPKALEAFGKLQVRRGKLVATKHEHCL